MLVEVEDSDGVVGHGEAPIVPVVTGEDEPGILAALTGPVRDAVLGADTDDLADLLSRVAAAVPGGRRRGPASTSRSTTWPLGGPAYPSPFSRRRVPASAPTCPPT